MSSSNCCFLTCTQISQEAVQVVWYSHLFQGFPQFIMIHAIKGFGLENKAEIYVFLELSCHLILINHFSHSTNENWLVYNKNLTGKIDRKIHSFCQPAIYQWHLYMAFIIHLFRHLIIIYYIPRTELTSGSAKTNNVNLCFKNIETQSRRLMSQWNVTVIMWWGW